MIFCFHFNYELCTDFCPTVKSTSQKSARPKSALRRQKVGTVDRQDLDMTEGENLEQEFGQETASNMIDVESISSYGLDDIGNSKCGETSNYASIKTPPKLKFKKVVKLTGLNILMPATVWQILIMKGIQWPETEIRWIFWNLFGKICENTLYEFIFVGVSLFGTTAQSASPLLELNQFWLQGFFDDSAANLIRIRLKHDFLLQMSPGIEDCPCLPHRIAIAQWVEWIQKLISFRHKGPKGMYYRYYISIFSKADWESK